MKKKWLLPLAGLMIILVLSACGTKSQEDVVKALSEKVETLKSYQATAKMTLQMGEEPQTYDVEISHKEPNFYRVHLKNAQKDQSQMILRNNEGVYVLTPALNKSFRFQSDWPNNSSQAYLYQSLVRDILEDKDAKFTATKDAYVFETKTRYQNNKMLPFQEITLDKKTLTPVKVKVMDTDGNALVSVDFSNMKFDVALEQKDFDMQKNMTTAQLDVPVMTEETEGEEFSVKYPTETIGTELVEEKEMKMENGNRVILTYEGEKSFTLTQEKSLALPATAGSTNVNGEPVDLGFTIGALTEQTITWTYNGVDYMIASTELTAEELTTIARSVQGEAIK
ncbi:outer membrane lipoprotein carrier protein LolA [Bacillaceae bacterium Marseille-Q3522]|nr:outer membrane lipoprotein carrier protein LolA [Bacillaceae bacterium Marseille-Q3522]